MSAGVDGVRMCGKESKGCGSRDQIRRPARYQTPAAHKATKVGERPTVRYRVDLSDSLFCVLPLLQSRGHSNREAAAPQSQEHKTALLGVFLHTVRIARKCDRPQCNRVMVRAKENAATDRGGRLDTHPHRVLGLGNGQWAVDITRNSPENNNKLKRGTRTYSRIAAQSTCC